MSSTIRQLIERLAKGASGSGFEDAARRFDALPLYEGWEGWALLTDQGEVLEATDEGATSPASEPLRTMYLVAGAEKYPELAALLPARPAASSVCAHCDGTGWVKLGTEGGRFRCGECRALGWVETPCKSSP
jgi:hypothetical protein